MLERQHIQLTAGVQKMYKHLSKGDGWPGANLEDVSDHDGRPPTHQILEALGVLQSAPYDQEDHSDHTREIFKEHSPEDGMMMTSATTQITLPPMIQTLTQPILPASPIMARRPSNPEIDLIAIDQGKAEMPPLFSLPPYQKQGPAFDAKMASSTQHQRQFPIYQVDDHMDFGLGKSNSISGNGGMMDVDWTAIADAFESNQVLVPPVQLD